MILHLLQHVVFFSEQMSLEFPIPWNVHGMDFMRILHTAWPEFYPAAEIENAFVKRI